MPVVLGIDAAWTLKQPSGVALLDTERQSNCLAVAPSYSSFLKVLDGGPVAWDAVQPGGEPPVAELIAASERLARKHVDVVAIDMPVSKELISGRREADRAISRAFGARWCAAHSPSERRPGELGARLSKIFDVLGYPLATTDTAPGRRNHLVEVYPHPALLALLNRPRRVPYKVAKTRKYWPDATYETRLQLLTEEMRAVEIGLRRELGTLPFSIPAAGELRTLAGLKPYEDALDALISAWVGVLYLNRAAVPLGDVTAAIWCPGAAFDPHGQEAL